MDAPPPPPAPKALGAKSALQKMAPAQVVANPAKATGSDGMRSLTRALGLKINRVVITDANKKAMNGDDDEDPGYRLNNGIATINIDGPMIEEDGSGLWKVSDIGLAFALITKACAEKIAMQAKATILQNGPVCFGSMILRP
jgi:hypothetical protein